MADVFEDHGSRPKITDQGRYVALAEGIGVFLLGDVWV